MLPRLLLILALALLAGCSTPPANRYPPVELAPNQHPTPAANR